MNTETNEVLRVDPEQVAILMARARRARSVAVGNLVARLVHRLTPQLHLRPWGTHWG